MFTSPFDLKPQTIVTSWHLTWTFFSCSKAKTLDIRMHACILFSQDFKVHIQAAAQPLQMSNSSRAWLLLVLTWWRCFTQSFNSCVNSCLSEAYTYSVLCYQWRNKKVVLASNYYKSLDTKYNSYYIFITPVFKTPKYKFTFNYFLFFKNNFINWLQLALKF